MVDRISDVAEGIARLQLTPATLDTLRTRLPAVADEVVDVITVEVPTYANAFAGPMGETIRGAVQLALRTFLRVAERTDPDPAEVLSRSSAGAYDLGRGEARSGRSMDALLAAYRIGGRVAWRELAASVVEHGVPAETLALFAELVFAYIDELSGSSVAGHSDELATSGRVRERYLERLAQHLLQGAPADVLTAAADRAGWEPPRTLTAVLLPENRLSGLLSHLDARTLLVTEQGPAVLLVPDADRPHLRRLLQGREAVLGPARPWQQVRVSYDRALRALDLDGDPVETEDHLTALVLTADPEALADLRARALAPLADLRPGTAAKLAETLRAWLLHQGRREEAAAALFVHPQTVRYRMGQLRDLYGETLDDPEALLDLLIALAEPAVDTRR